MKMVISSQKLTWLDLVGFFVLLAGLGIFVFSLGEQHGRLETGAAWGQYMHFLEASNARQFDWRCQQRVAYWNQVGECNTQCAHPERIALKH